MFNKNISCNKNETKSNGTKIPHTVLERQTSCFSSYKNQLWKVKLWWAGSRERKRVHFLKLLFCPKYILNICVLSQMCSILNKLSEYIYFYISKNIHTLLLRVFKIVESLQCIAKLTEMKFLWRHVTTVVVVVSVFFKFNYLISSPIVAIISVKVFWKVACKRFTYWNS